VETGASGTNLAKLDSHLVVADLVRNLRHQLRTPVNHIVGFSEMLEEEAVSQGWVAMAPDLKRIQQAGRGLASFIGETVDLAKVETASLDAEQISQDLRTPLESIVGYSQLLQEEARDNGWAGAVSDLQKVESAAKHLTSLIAVVLDLAKVYESPLPQRVVAGERPAPAPLGQLAEDTVSISVLLADDDELDAEALTRRLKQLGHSVLVVPDGRALLEILDDRQFDVFMLDVLMPNMDGLETLRAIKANPAHRDTPVLMISAVEEIPIVARCIELGADDYLSKPVDTILLRAKLNAAFERTRWRDRELGYLSQMARLAAAAAALESKTFEAGSLADIAAQNDAPGRLAQTLERMAR